MSLDYKAFTYLIVNEINNKWYYGVKYAKGCNVKELFESYFSSSELVKCELQKFGRNAFRAEVRRVFKDVDSAKNWEVKVLRRMKVRTNGHSYNKHYNRGFVTHCGENNPAKRLDVRAKLRSSASGRVMSLESVEKGKISNIKRNIALLLRSRKTHDLLTMRKQKKDLYGKYIQFLNQYKPNCTRIISFFVQLLSACENMPKVYPKNRKGWKLTEEQSRQRGNRISKSLSGRMWFTSPDLTEMKRVYHKDEVPSNWIRGMRTKEKIEKNRRASTGKLHTEKTKAKLSTIGKRKIYYTSPDLQIVRVFYNDSDAPENWIKGNKLKTRNEKLRK
jgi:hypothetical protein